MMCISKTSSTKKPNLGNEYANFRSTDKVLDVVLDQAMFEFDEQLRTVKLVRQVHMDFAM